MNEFLEKMKKIINSKEFIKDATNFFEEIFSEGEYDVDDCERKTIDYLYNKYFIKHEEEYYSLDNIEYQFEDVIVEVYEDIVYKISFYLTNVYNLNIFSDTECKTRCNSCGKNINNYMNINFKPNIDEEPFYYDGTQNLNLCRECARELRDFINNSVI